MGEPGADRPVARVLVDVPLPHLDRPFDYLVPPNLSAVAVPGVRVRVRFAGRTVGGYLLDRGATSEHPGRLTPLSGVVSPEPVLAPEVAEAARAVAERYVGHTADVLRAAVPPRHARVEAAPSPPPAPPPPPPADPGGWAACRGGRDLLAALAGGAAPRRVWTAPPGPGWPAALALAVQATLAGGRGALVVVPDARDAFRVDAALTAAVGVGRHVVLLADLGPAERYRRWLAVRRGAVRAVVGTRGAALAPVADLGLVAVWDDGDDLHAEPHAPYWHVREVLTLRAHQQGAAALVGGFTRSVEAAALLATGWARPCAPERAVLRRQAPRVQVAGEDAELAGDPAARAARLPSLAWQAAREALARGPVLVQVPRRGYLPGLACRSCRASARCARCGGPLELASGHAVAGCRWCGRPAGGWRCPACGGSGWRAQVVGAGRTAEELGRAFPGVPVRTSGGDAVLPAVPARPALVVATPGAEPWADGGYAAALLLDGWLLLSRPDLRAGEEALRRWAAAAALVRSAAQGGRVVLVADPGLPAVQALVRWDPAGFAERELAERTELHLPPAARVAALTGAPGDVAELVELARLPPDAEVLGPVPVARPGEPPGARVLVRVPWRRGRELAQALRAAAGVRAAARAGGPVRVEVDPRELG